MKPGPSTPAASPASTPDNLRERLDQFMPLLKRPLSLEVIRKVKDADIDGIRQLVNARQKHVVTYRNAKFGVGAVGMTPSAKDCIFLSDQRDVFARVWDELGLYEIFRAGFRDGNYNDFKAYMEVLITHAQDELALFEWRVSNDPKLDHALQIAGAIEREMQAVLPDSYQKVNLLTPEKAQEFALKFKMDLAYFESNPAFVDPDRLPLIFHKIWLIFDLNMLTSSDVRRRYFMDALSRYLRLKLADCETRAAGGVVQPSSGDEDFVMLPPQPSGPRREGLPSSLPPDFAEALMELEAPPDGLFFDYVNSLAPEKATPMARRRKKKLELYEGVRKGTAKMKANDILLFLSVVRNFKEVWDRFDLEDLQDSDPTSILIFNFINKLMQRAQAELAAFESVAQGRRADPATPDSVTELSDSSPI